MLFFVLNVLPFLGERSGALLLAQDTTNCDNAIDEAAELYNAGKYDNCISFLENAIKTCKLSKKKREKAYELIINSNLEKDNLAASDSGFKNLLHNNPMYDIKDYNGLDEYLKLYSNYYVYPKISLGIRLLYAKPFIKASKVFDVIPDANYNAKYNMEKFYNAALFFDYRIKEKISLYADASQFTINYNRELSNEYWKLNYKEKLNIIELNLCMKYHFNTQKKLNYYIYGGIGNQLITSNKISFNQERKMVDPYNETISFSKTSLVDFNSSLLRNKYQFSAIIGAGLTYRIGHIGVGADVRVNQTINHLNDRNTRFYESLLIRDYSYIENNMRLRKIEAAVNICYYFKFNAKNKKQN